MTEYRATPDLIMEKLVGLHQILPSQYFDVSGAHRLTAEQRLMLALLADAINVYQQGVLSRATRKRILYLDAERWITSASAVPNFFSFETVCEALEINPSVLRRRIVSWKHQVCRDADMRDADMRDADRRDDDRRVTPHLRLKITPRARHMSHSRRRPSSMTTPALAHE